MSPHEHTDDAAAYVLGALEPSEAEAFRRHLDQCTICQDEVTAFRAAVAELPAAAPQYRAPKELRRRVIRAVRADARTRAAAQPSSAGRRRARLGAWRPFPVAAFAAAAAAAAAVALAVLGGIELAKGPASPVPRTVTASVGDARLQLTGSHAELIVGHLPALRADEVYELWIRVGERPPQPTNTLFTVSRDGTANIGVPRAVSSDTAVMVTAEPAGGTQQPTTAPVIVARAS